MKNQNTQLMQSGDQSNLMDMRHGPLTGSPDVKVFFPALSSAVNDGNKPQQEQYNTCSRHFPRPDKIYQWQEPNTCPTAGSGSTSPEASSSTSPQRQGTKMDVNPDVALYSSSSSSSSFASSPSTSATSPASRAQAPVALPASSSVLLGSSPFHPQHSATARRDDGPINAGVVQCPLTATTAARPATGTNTNGVAEMDLPGQDLLPPQTFWESRSPTWMSRKTAPASSFVKQAAAPNSSCSMPSSSSCASSSSSSSSSSSTSPTLEGLLTLKQTSASGQERRELVATDASIFSSSLSSNAPPCHVTQAFEITSEPGYNPSQLQETPSNYRWALNSHGNSRLHHSAWQTGTLEARGAGTICFPGSNAHVLALEKNPIDRHGPRGSRITTDATSPFDVVTLEAKNGIAVGKCASRDTPLSTASREMNRQHSQKQRHRQRQPRQNCHQHALTQDHVDYLPIRENLKGKRSGHASMTMPDGNRQVRKPFQEDPLVSASESQEIDPSSWNSVKQAQSSSPYESLPLQYPLRENDLLTGPSLSPVFRFLPNEVLDGTPTTQAQQRLKRQEDEEESEGFIHYSRTMSSKPVPSVSTQGLCRSTNSCASAFKSFANAGDEEGAEEAFCQLKNQNGRPGVYLYNALLSTYASNGNSEGAEAVLNGMKDDEAEFGFGPEKAVEPNVVTYSSLMTAYAIKGHSEGAERVLARMQVAGMQPNLVTYNSLATAYAKGGNWQGANQVLKRMQQSQQLEPTVTTYNAVLNAHANKGHWKGAEEVVQHMNESNVQPNTTTYNTLIDAYANKGNWEGAEDVLRRMNKLNEVEPNVISFSSVINAYAHRGNWHGAENVLRRMQYQGLQPNLITYNSLVTAYAKEGHWQGAEDVLRRMHANPHVEPNTTTYNLVINSYANKGHWKGAEDVLQRMLTVGHSLGSGGSGSAIAPTVMTYNSLINAHAKDGNWKGAEDVLRRLLERGVEPNVTTFNSVIKAYTKEGHIEGVENVLTRMTDDFGLKANVTTWSSIINAYATRGDFVGAEDVLRRMQEHGVEPNITTFSSVINAYANKGHWVGAESVLSRLEVKGLEPDVITHNSMLKVYVNARDVDGCGRGLDLVRRLLEGRRHKPTHVTFKTLFTLLLKHPDPRKLQTAMKLLDDHVPARSRTSLVYAPLIELCGATGRADAAVRYFEEARRGGHLDKYVVRAARAAGMIVGGSCGIGDNGVRGRGRTWARQSHSQHYAASTFASVASLSSSLETL
ncbi:pentatricopeptide repeat containing protein [Nannochloropsis gaditana]|nr:pentatricopeptide repeat containing protein [Nannochloropsis gaditana]